MMKKAQRLMWILVFTGLNSLLYSAQNPHVVVETNYGNMMLELYPDKAPMTVDNFLNYVNEDFYDGLIFHRVIEGFMIQGGGYYLDGYTISPFPPTHGPIPNESDNNLSNLRGTIAMARTNEPHSATSQFFINHVDNYFLDRANASDGYGYCVFGKIVDGLDVVDAIAQSDVCYVSAALTHFPCNPPVSIHRSYVLPCQMSYCSNLTSLTQINFEDFAEFASHWLDNCKSENRFCNGSDLNYNGTVDVEDLAIFIEHWSRTAGYEPVFSDFDTTGTVGSEDMSLLVAEWLGADCKKENNFCLGADIDQNGTVDLTDFALFSRNWQVNY